MPALPLDGEGTESWGARKLTRRHRPSAQHGRDQNPDPPDAQPRALSHELPAPSDQGELLGGSAPTYTRDVHTDTAELKAPSSSVQSSGRRKAASP